MLEITEALPGTPRWKQSFAGGYRQTEPQQGEGQASQEETETTAQGLGARSVKMTT